MTRWPSTPGGGAESRIPVVDEGVDFTEDGVTVTGQVADTFDGGVGVQTTSTAVGVTNASYTSSFSPGADFPKAVEFRPDGTTMYVYHGQSGVIVAYTLSTPWDVTTASQQGSFDTSGQVSNPASFAFSADGTQLVAVDDNNDRVVEYLLSAAWDVSTAGYHSDFNYSADASAVNGVAFNDDGTTMYLINADGFLHYYDLSTPFSPDSASYISLNNLSGNIGSGAEVAFSSGGESMLILDLQNADVEAFTLSTPWDVTTDSRQGTLSLEHGNPRGLAVGDSDGRLFVSDQGSDTVDAYRIGGVAQEGDTTLVSFPERPDLGEWTVLRSNLSPDGATVTLDVIDVSDGGEQVVAADVGTEADLSDLSPSANPALRATYTDIGESSPQIEYVGRLGHR